LRTPQIEHFFAGRQPQENCFCSAPVVQANQ